MSKPTIGRIVNYTTTALDQKIIGEHPLCTNQAILPAVIVAVNEDESVNLKVLCDGPQDYYVKGVQASEEEGGYQWPVIQKATDHATTQQFTELSQQVSTLEEKFKTFTSAPAQEKISTESKDPVKPKS